MAHWFDRTYRGRSNWGRGNGLAYGNWSSPGRGLHGFWLLSGRTGGNGWEPLGKKERSIGVDLYSGNTLGDGRLAHPPNEPRWSEL